MRLGKVIAAAIRDEVSGAIYTEPPPARHHNLIHAMVDEHGLTPPIGGARFTQGFLCEKDNTFVSRGRAELEARESGQLTKPLIGSVLTSEDLW